MKQLKIRHGFIDVDDEDYEFLSGFEWFIWTGGFKQKFVTRKTLVGESGQRIKMHNVILPPTEGLEVDHINRNTLDNRRSNLRLVSHRENSLNRSLFSNNKSGFRGVCRRGQRGSWLAQIKANGVKIHLGSYKTKIDAAIAYDMAALMANGKFAQTNVIK